MADGGQARDGSGEPGSADAGSGGIGVEASGLGVFEAADPAADGWGTAFGSGYLLQREIGVGGMGTVWRGWALGTQRAVAIKILHPHLSADQSVVARFLREGDVLKRLEHPHLVKVHDLVVEGGKLGLVMDLVEGGDLHARRKRHGTLPPAEVARIGAQAAGALAAAHALGVAHLDLKPANILISAASGGASEAINVRLTDFGIARIVDTPDQATTTTTYGTPDYMAPETALTGATGPASDLYALGITLYEVLVGRTPHGGGQALAVLARHIERQPKRLPGIPDSLWEVIVACTAREPADRPDATSVAAQLAAAEPGLAGLPALEAVPRSSAFEVTSEPRTVGADRTTDSLTVAVPWLAAVAAANRDTEAVIVSGEPSSAGQAGGGDVAFAAAVLKPPPEGPFSTAPPLPDRRRPRLHLLSLSGRSRRRAVLVAAPLLVLAVVFGSLLASGTFSGSAHASSTTGSDALGAPGGGQVSGSGVATHGASGSASRSASAKASASATKSAASAGTSAPAHPSSSRSAGSGDAASSQGPGRSQSQGGATASTTRATTVGAPTTKAASRSPSPTPTDTGWVCRVGGFKVDGALSEDPCVRDDDGSLMLEGQLKGTYDSPVVVVVRVKYGNTYSSPNISETVTPAQLDGKTFTYQVTLGPWAAGAEITCQENIDPASAKTDYAYAANSADLRTSP